MKISCKDCGITWHNLSEYMRRDCNNIKCKLLKPEALVAERAKDKQVETKEVVPFVPIPHQMKMRVLRRECEVVSHYDPTEKCLYVEAPKVVVVNIYPKRK